MLAFLRVVATPHELLHVLGYKLVGKAYRYRLGDPFVAEIDELTRREKLIVGLLPFAVTGLMAVAFMMGLPLLVQLDDPLWIACYAILSVGLLTYTGFSIIDLRDAYQLLTGQDKTPFDPIIRYNTYFLRPRESLTHVWVMLIISIALLIWNLLTPQA
jgi:hypothetical protein